MKRYHLKLILLAFIVVCIMQSCSVKKFRQSDHVYTKESLSRMEHIVIYDDFYKLPEWVLLCANLKTIVFSKTNHLDFSDAFEKLSTLDSLRSIELSGIEMQMPDNVRKLKNLKSIVFKRRCKIDFYDAIEKLSKVEQLRTLYIDNCNLEKIPENIYKLKYLWSLSLERTNLVALPDSIIYCSELKHLSLSDNKISEQSLAFVLSHLTDLESLYLSHNNLSYLPDAICSTKILDLHICDNPIDSLPECLFYSNTLKWLYLDCHYQDMPKIRSRMNVKAIREKMQATTGRFVDVR
jgi:hypothetical protein